jgi:hypothetical protein
MQLFERFGYSNMNIELFRWCAFVLAFVLSTSVARATELSVQANELAIIYKRTKERSLSDQGRFEKLEQRLTEKTTDLRKQIEQYDMSLRSDYGLYEKLATQRRVQDQEYVKRRVETNFRKRVASQQAYDHAKSVLKESSGVLALTELSAVPVPAERNLASYVSGLKTSLTDVAPGSQIFETTDSPSTSSALPSSVK